jgi:hypothetical protein
MSGCDVGGERDRPDTDRLAILEPVVNARWGEPRTPIQTRALTGRMTSGSSPPEARESARACLGINDVPTPTPVRGA